MRIRTFTKFIEVEELKPFKLKNEVVIDAQNFFLGVYGNRELPYTYGCEANRYGDILKDYLMMFKKANVKCYFILKGGDKDVNKKIAKIRTDSVVNPIFMRETYKQILDIMGFDYTVTVNDAKTECIALAQKLNCPIISFDIEFSFSAVKYIPKPTLEFNIRDNSISCSVFELNKFLQKHVLTVEKISLFVVLRDTNIFPEDFFFDFMKTLTPKMGDYKRNCSLLQWLSKTPFEVAIERIFNPHFRHTDQEAKKKFLENLRKTRDFVGKQHPIGIPSLCLLKDESAQFEEKDPNWFGNGVANKFISIPYINMYNSKVLRGSFNHSYKEYNDPMLLSLDIVKYAYDLLTNFTSESFDDFKFVKYNVCELSEEEQEIINGVRSIKKPEYEAYQSVFENAWSQISQLKLMEHFLTETLEHFDFEQLQKVSEDVRMIVIALAYFSQKKGSDVLNIAYAVLLSYVMINVVFERINEENSATEEDTSDFCTEKCATEEDKNSDCYKEVTYSDCENARVCLREYFNCSDHRLDEKLNHPFVEFQHCLEQLNYLNALCGSTFKPTIYSKVFNGTFTYNIIYCIEKDNDGDGDGMLFIKKTLHSAPTVFGLFSNLVETYQQLVSVSVAGI